VVITGLGVATPIGIGMDAFWEGLLQQRCGIRRLESFDPSGLPCQVAGELPPFQLGDFIPKSYRKSVKVMSRDIVLAVISAYQAVVDAGLNTKCIVTRRGPGRPTSIAPLRGQHRSRLVCADLNELAGALTAR
jgi:3-oxoacyl-[acyl-carrier-protein] synthase II